MKKLMSIFLSVVILLSVFTGFEITAYAATRSGTTGGLNWSLDTDTGVFTLSCGTGTRGAGYENKTTNRSPWYTYRSQIKSVVVEDGVVEIGAYSFYNCTNLSSVNIADSVDTIGYCCFRSCSSLANVTLPSGCSWMYKEVFLDCTSLKWAILPENNYTNDYSGKIPDGTFSGCTSLEEVIVGSGITALDQKAFYNCKALNGVVWESGEISSVSTNVFTNVPSSCTFVSENSLSDWCSTNGFAFQNITDTCSDNTYTSEKLTYSFDSDNLKLNFSGSGDMNIKPWSVYHYFIRNIDFSATDGNYSISSSAFESTPYLDTVVLGDYLTSVGDSAFYNCTSTTYWLNIPSTATSIGSKAFLNTNMNYVTIASPSIVIADDAFSTGYARFFGLHDSGARDFVKQGQSNGYGWYYYCLNDDHDYQNITYAPTCTEQGYDWYGCIYCDVESYKSNYTDSSDHNYRYTGTDGSDIVYYCTECGETGFKIDSILVETLFGDSISHDNDKAPYNQSNYDGRADVYLDGYVNAKDFLSIENIINSVSTLNKETTIDETTTYQTIEGFGASAAWWSQDAGGWDNIDDIMELLYGTDNGIGLNIYRYNLGAGSEDDTEISDWRRRAEDFLSSSSDINDASTYDWNADVNARLALAAAQNANSNLKVTLFSNSAPVSITDNGKAYCSLGSTSNLSESQYQAFANYIVNCAEHFIEEGYNVTSVSPINEPEWGWAEWQNSDGSYSMNQEGCHWEAAQLRTFYNDYMVPALKNSSLNGKVDLSVWESGQLNHSSYWSTFLNYFFSSSTSSILSSNKYGNYNQNIRDYVNSVDTHSYWCSTSDRETVASQLTDSNYSAITKIRCTEYCQMTNDGSSNLLGHAQAYGDTNGMDIDYGLALADIIYQDLTILNSVEWDWWTACSAGIYPDGLVYINYNNPSDIQTSKRLWCLGNYSKFIDEGATRISVSTGSEFGANLVTNKTYTWTNTDSNGNVTSSGVDKNNYLEESAYLNPDGTVVVVYVNNSDTNEHTQFDSSKYSTFETYVTNDTYDLKKCQSGNVGSQAVSIPAKSVTTVVLSK